MEVRLKEKNSASLVFIGSVVPDEPAYWNDAFSRAGNMAQEGIIQSLIQIDPNLTILSFPPTPVFPRGQRIASRQAKVSRDGLVYHFVPFMNLPIIKYPNISLEVLVSLARSIKEARSEKVYIISYNFNSFISLPLVVARLAGRMLGKQVYLVPILFDVDIPGETVPSTAARKLDYSLFSLLIREIDGMIGITEGIIRDFSSDKPTMLLEGGVKSQSIERFYLLNRNADRNFNILLAGALELYNGVDILLDVMRYIDDPSIKLIVAGKGTLSSEVEAAARKDHRIEYVGYISHDELVDLYSRADVLINHRSHQRINSDYVFPSKLLEYLLTGIPTISTRFSSLPDEYGQYLHLVDGENTAELAEAIMQIKASTRGRDMSAADFIRREKSWKAWSGKIEGFLRRL